MQSCRNLFVGILSCAVGMVSLLSLGRAEAAGGGLPACQAQLATCTSDVGTCQTDLEAYEAAPCAVFPGDGVTGPALKYKNNGDGTFTDRNTQLVWEKKDNRGGVHDVGNMYLWSSSGTAADGSLFTTFLTTLNTPPCFAGHCDWRIPNIKELQSIVDYSKVEPATSVPGATAVSFYWSSTSDANTPSFAWLVYFFNGFMGSDNKSFNLIHARAVQGGS
jgi:hypothetical protein